MISITGLQLISQSYDQAKYSNFHISLWCCMNSLAPGKFEWNFRYLILQIISVSDGWGISCELVLRWMSLDLTDDKSSLVQVMAWCRQYQTQKQNFSFKEFYLKMLFAIAYFVQDPLWLTTKFILISWFGNKCLIVSQKLCFGFKSVKISPHNLS